MKLVKFSPLLLKICSRFCLQRGAMKCLFASAFSSSSGSAARPAATAAPSSSGSAAQPVTTAAPGSCGSSAWRGTSTTSSKQLGITTMHGVQLWLAEDYIASCTSAEAQRIREAVAVLSRPNPRKEEARPLQTKWQVAQKQSATAVRRHRRVPGQSHQSSSKVTTGASKQC